MESFRYDAATSLKVRLDVLGGFPIYLNSHSTMFFKTVAAAKDDEGRLLRLLCSVTAPDYLQVSTAPALAAELLTGDRPLKRKEPDDLDPGPVPPTEGPARKRNTLKKLPPVTPEQWEALIKEKVLDANRGVAAMKKANGVREGQLWSKNRDLLAQNAQLRIENETLRRENEQSHTDNAALAFRLVALANKLADLVGLVPAQPPAAPDPGSLGAPPHS